MYCSSCGTQLQEAYRFCYHCGRPTYPEYTSPWGEPRSLSRPLWEKKISGVCAGFARYFEMDVTLMRVLWLVISLVTGVGFIAYLVAWIAMPAQPYPVLPQAPTMPPPSAAQGTSQPGHQNDAFGAVGSPS